MLVLLTCFLILSLPPLFVFQDVFRQSDLTRQSYLNFALMLTYWLMLLAIPAFLAARHRSRRVKGREHGSETSG
jgi:hypothetical protein